MIPFGVMQEPPHFEPTLESSGIVIVVVSTESFTGSIIKNVVESEGGQYILPFGANTADFHLLLPPDTIKDVLSDTLAEMSYFNIEVWLLGMKNTFPLGDNIPQL